MSRIQKRFGWRERRTLWALRIAAHGMVALIRRKIYGWLGIRHFRGMQIRPGTIDIWTLGETFFEGKWDPLCDRPSEEVHAILDLGANIGDSAVYFAQRYPQAKIIAVECLAANVELLKTNTRPYPNVTVLHAVISSVAPLEEEKHFVPEVDRVTVPELMQRFSIDRFNIVKIDIEGGERFLFRGDCSWLRRVDDLGINLFDLRYSGCSLAFFRAISIYFDGLYDFVSKDETTTYFVKRYFGKPRMPQGSRLFE